MGSNNTITDFNKDDLVYYVPRHLQPLERESPMFKDCQEGIVTSIRYPWVFVKYKIKSKTFTGKDYSKYQITSQATKPEDLWK